MSKKLSLFGRVRRNLRTKLITGIITLIPLGITFLVLRFLFNSIEDITRPILSRILAYFFADLSLWRMSGYLVPVAGIIITAVIVYTVGALASNLIGKRVIKFGERILGRIPLVRDIYTASRQITDALTASGKMQFKRVVLIEFPRPGIMVIGFVTSVMNNGADGRKFLSVFVPTTPNPTSGFLELVPEEETTDTTLTVEEALKMVISGGILSPDKADFIKRKVRV
jgi:uncharacterized membrane protein